MTASYFNAILDSKNYTNSTFTIDSNYVDSETNEEIPIVKFVYKFGADAMYKSDYYQLEDFSESSINYLNYKDNVLFSYYNVGEEWIFDYDVAEDAKSAENSYIGTILGYINSIFEELLPFDEFDHSAFVKTLEGFTMREESLAEYIKDDEEDVKNPTFNVIIKENIITEVYIGSDYGGTKLKIFDVSLTKVDLPKEFLDQIQSVNK